MRYYLAALLLLTCTTINAQDTIYYKHLPPNIVQLEVITPTKIHFRHVDAPKGPMYHIHVRDVAKAITADGTVAYLDDANMQIAQKKFGQVAPTTHIDMHRRYPSNIITLVPVAVLSADAQGTGISYERILNNHSTFAIRLPAFVTIRRTSGYFMPALRFYPFGQRVATLFISAGLFGAYGDRQIRRDSLRNTTGGYAPYVQEVTEWQFGFYADGGLNLHMGNNMFINLTAGSGLNYLDLTRGGDYTYPAMGKVELGLGYRFGREQ